MMIRLALCAVVVLGCGYVGFSYAARIMTRAAQIREAEGVLCRLIFHVGFLSVPFARALCLAAKQPGEVCAMLCTTGTLLMQDPGRSPEDAFGAAIARCGRNFCLQDAEIDALRELMRYAGRGDRENMQSSIRFTRAKLQLIREEAEAQYHRDGRLYRGLGFLSGMLIVILLL